MTMGLREVQPGVPDVPPAEARLRTKVVTDCKETAKSLLDPREPEWGGGGGEQGWTVGSPVRL